MEARSTIYKVFIALTALFVVASVALPHHHHHNSIHEICFVIDHCGGSSSEHQHAQPTSDPCGSCPLDNQTLISAHTASEHKCSVDSCNHDHDEDQRLPYPLFAGIISSSDFSITLTSRPVVYRGPEVDYTQKNNHSAAQLRAPPIA